MTKEELEKELEKLKDFKLYVFEGDVYVRAEDYKEKAIENRKLKEKLSKITMVADDEKQSIEHILELEEENKKLKEELEKWKDTVKTQNEYNKFRIQENKMLKKENENLKAIIDHYKKFEEGKEKLEGMLMEEDTLQELRDLGKI